MDEQQVVTRRWTPEQQKKLGGFFAIKPGAQFLYVPKAYRENGAPKDMWPVFTLRATDGVQALEREDALGSEIEYSKTGSQKFKFQSGLQKKITVMNGVVTWRNYRYADGSLVQAPEAASGGGITEAALRVLPPNLITELANAITENMQLTAEELEGLE